METARLAALLLFIGGVKAEQCAQWSAMGAPKALSHRNSAASCAGWLHGGTTGSNILSDLWKYDGEWKRISPDGSTPGARYDHTIVPGLGTFTLVLFGGVSSGVTMHDAWGFHEESNTWTEIKSTAPPGPLKGHTSVTVTESSGSGSMLVFGGSNGSSTSLDVLWRLTLGDDGQSANWTKVSTQGASPSPRQLHSATVVQDGMLVYGGCNGESCNDACSSTAPLGDLWKLDWSTLEWSMLYDTTDSGPSPRYGHSALRNQEQLAVVAGSACVSNSSSSAELSNQPAIELWLYNVQTSSWALSTNTQCLGPADNANIRPYFQLKDSLTALFYGNDLELQDRSPAAWGIQMSEQDSCPAQCSGRGECVQPDRELYMECACYPFESDGGTSCGDNSYNFQWYLLYSAFGVTVLLLCFFLRRVYSCVSRRNRLGRWNQIGEGLLEDQPADEQWTEADLEDFIAKQPPTTMAKLSDCDICMDNGTDLQLLPCDHVLCHECACKILAAQLVCPFCRGEVSAARRIVAVEVKPSESASDDEKEEVCLNDSRNTRVNTAEQDCQNCTNPKPNPPQNDTATS